MEGRSGNSTCVSMKCKDMVVTGHVCKSKGVLRAHARHQVKLALSDEYIYYDYLTVLTMTGLSARPTHGLKRKVSAIVKGLLSYCCGGILCGDHAIHASTCMTDHQHESSTYPRCILDRALGRREWLGRRESRLTPDERDERADRTTRACMTISPALDSLCSVETRDIPYGKKKAHARSMQARLSATMSLSDDLQEGLVPSTKVMHLYFTHCISDCLTRIDAIYTVYSTGCQ